MEQYRGCYSFVSLLIGHLRSKMVVHCSKDEHPCMNGYESKNFQRRNMPSNFIFHDFGIEAQSHVRYRDSTLYAERMQN